MRKSKTDDKATVVDFQQLRTKKIDEKRRKNQRIFFKKLLGVYCVADDDGIRPVEIVDASEDGLSFIAAFDSQQPWPRDVQKPLPLRIYFSQDSYIALQLRIVHSGSVKDEDVSQIIDSRSKGQIWVRYGCVVDQTLSSYQVYQQFIRFLQLYSENALQDKGRTSLFYL